MRKLHEIVTPPKPDPPKRPKVIAKSVTEIQGLDHLAKYKQKHTPNQTRDFSKCPRCGRPTIPAVCIDGNDSEYWKTCSNWSCNTYINTFIPMAHQHAVQTSPQKIVGNFGGYGSGKTAATREDLIKHLLITPNANALVGAKVTSQYEQTLQRDFNATFPIDFVRHQSLQKNYIDMQNGARLLYRPFDDAGKLRSYNLSYFVIIEASEVDFEAFVQLRARLRNEAALYGHHDWRKGIIESNPDSGWIKDEVLDVSSYIRYFSDNFEPAKQLKSKIDPTVASVVSSSAANKYLPKNFIAENARNKPEWWVAKFLHASFMFSEGLVYPAAQKHFIPDFKIPRHWRRMVAFDYGLHDDAVWLYAALDEEKGILYVYKELRTNNADIDQLAELYFRGADDIPQGAMLGSIIGDPRNLAKRGYDKKNLYDLFLEKGILIKPGAVSVDARVLRLNAYLEAGKIKIMEGCSGLVREITHYKFPERQLLKKPRSYWNKPVDKDNHAINPLEWIVMELPDDPRQMMLGVYNKYGRAATDIDRLQEKRWLPHALQDDTEAPEDTFMSAGSVVFDI